MPIEAKGKPLPRNRRGTSTKLTPETQERIVQALKTGAYRHTAANFAGIGRATLNEWLLKGEEGREPYKAFRDAVERAEAEFIIASVSTIRLQSKTQWQAAAWLLERKYPELYGQRARLPMLPEGEQAPVPFVMVVPGQVSAEEWAANPTGALPSPRPVDARRSGAVDLDPDDEADLEVPEEAPGPEEDEPEEPEHVDPADVEPDYGDE